MASFSFSTNQTTLSSSDELSVNVSLDLQNNKTYYLEAAFKKVGGTNYFGLTWNDGSWVSYTASAYLSIKTITTDNSGRWNGSLKAKVDTSSNYYSGSGNYLFQLKRFTSTGTDYWSDNSITLSINDPTPMPTSKPSTTPAPTHTPSPTTAPAVIFIATPQNTSLKVSETLNVLVNLQNLTPNSSYYLKGAFAKQDSSNYFGKTKVSGSWIKNSQTYTQQLPITTDQNGNWTGQLEIMADPDDSGYTGSGDYIFKVGRYKSDSSSVSWSNQTKIELLADSPTSQDSTSNTNPKPLPSTIQDKQLKSNLPSVINTKRKIPNLSNSTSSVAGSHTSSPSAVAVKSEKGINLYILFGIFLITLSGASVLVYFKIVKPRYGRYNKFS